MTLVFEDKETRKEKRKKRLTFGDEIFVEKWFTYDVVNKMVKKCGFTCKQGRYQKHEKEIIDKQIDEFCFEYDLTKEILYQRYLRGYRNIENNITVLLKRIGKVLPGKRPLRSIYEHVLNNLCRHASEARPFTKEEDDLLLDLYDKFGPCWSKMVDEFYKRPHCTLRRRYRCLKKIDLHKKWEDSDIDLLKKSIKEGLVYGKKMKVSAWDYVSKKIGRKIVSCMLKWVEISKEESTELIWKPEDDWALCQKIYDLCVEDIDEIVWTDLARDGFFPWTHVKLKTKFRQLMKRVPSNGSMDESLQFLLISLQKNRPIKIEEFKTNNEESKEKVKENKEAIKVSSLL